MDDYGVDNVRDQRPVAHYYGDYVRIIFVTVALLSAFVIPLWGYILPVVPIVQIAFIIVLVLLAGLTSPVGTAVLWMDAFVAGLGALFIENAAITLYSETQVGIFLAREIIVLLLLLALYWSVKTVRAISAHQLGHANDLGEFDTPAERKYEDRP